MVGDGRHLQNGVGGPAGSKQAAKRCNEAIRPVGPTLKRRGGTGR